MPTRVELSFLEVGDGRGLVLGSHVQALFYEIFCRPTFAGGPQRRPKPGNYWSLDYSPEHDHRDGQVRVVLKWLDDDPTVFTDLLDFEDRTGGEVTLGRRTLLMGEMVRAAALPLSALIPGVPHSAWEWHVRTPAFHGRSGAILKPALAVIWRNLASTFAEHVDGAPPSLGALAELVGRSRIVEDRTWVTQMPAGFEHRDGKRWDKGASAQGYVGTFVVAVDPAAPREVHTLAGILSSWARWQGIGGQTGQGFGAVDTHPLEDARLPT